MNNSKIKISVIMSVFNQGQYLEESIRSILSQTFKNFEFIIVNDACSDKSPQILKYWADRDSRIKIITNEENIGLTKSLNKAIKEASGEYIVRQDSDDISLEERLEKQVSFLDLHTDVKILGTFGYRISEDGTIIGKQRVPVSSNTIKKYIIKKNPFMHTSVMMRKEIIE
ncbi:MAG: glycosyltransferase family 2 protein, partial [Patescibacteria group bacterium]